MRAIKCTKWISQHEAEKNQGNSSKPTKPTYFYADAQQLVHSAIRHYPPEDDLEAKLHLISSVKFPSGTLAIPKKEQSTLI
jgi:hypothetical protein